MPALVEAEEEEGEEDVEIKDPLPEKLQNSMVNLILNERCVATNDAVLVL